MTSTPPPPTTPAGWYPTDNPLQLRWWDGSAWTDNFETIQAPPAPAGAKVAEESVAALAPAPTEPEAVSDGHAVLDPIVSMKIRGSGGTRIELVGDDLIFKPTEDSPPKIILNFANASELVQSKNGKEIDVHVAGEGGKPEVRMFAATYFQRARSVKDDDWEAFVEAVRAGIERVQPKVETTTKELRAAAKAGSPKQPPIFRPGVLFGIIFGAVLGAGAAIVISIMAQLSVGGAVGFAIVAGIAGAIAGGVQTNKQAAADGEGGNPSFGGFTIYDDHIAYLGESQPLAGVSAAIETAGQISRHANVGGMVAGGILFGKAGALLNSGDKVRDDRELYMIVTGTKKQWVSKLSPKDTMMARQFAARINSASLGSTD